MTARQFPSIKIDVDDPSNDVRGVGEPGDYCFTYDGDGAVAGIHFLCERRHFHGVTFRAGSWQWDGNKERPTVTPSIASADCGLHVFLTNGEWQLCGDHGSYGRP